MSSETVVASPSTFTPALFRRSLGDALELAHGVDAVAAEERAASLAKRSLKKESKVWGLKLVISMIDLTTLEGKDTRGKVWALCQKAIRPDPSDREIPHVGAVCIYPTMIPFVKQALTGSGVKVASVATGFPSGQTFTSIKVDETRQAVAAGADFIKTSTGKVGVNATLPVTLVMLEAIRDFHHVTGKRVGMKPAGGISNAKLSLAYLVLLYETMGPEWMTPDLFRIGASSLLNDVLMQIRKERTGAYQSGDYFTLD